MITPGHERWHPEPRLLLPRRRRPAAGHGALLRHRAGAPARPGARRSIGAAAARAAERVIGSGPRAGERIPVEVDTHVTGVLEHARGALSTLTTSFDGVATTAAPIEVHGETRLARRARPEPLRRRGASPRTRRRPSGGPSSRPPATSAAPAAWGSSTSSPPKSRASGDLALHVLEVMSRAPRLRGGGAPDRPHHHDGTPRAGAPDPWPDEPDGSAWPGQPSRA